MHPFLNIAIRAATRAGDLINRYAGQLDRVKASEKQANDLVSEVDIKAEQIIIDTIHKAYPDHSILAEESGHTANKEEDITWIIDPLDGTRNFLHGFPFYGVSIALKHHNRIEHGVIYDPIRHECFSASRGCGARLNDKRIRVSQQTQLSKALLGTGFPFRNKQSLARPYLSTFERLFGECAGVRRAGAAALDLAYVASGRLDGFWEFSLNPWDIAAGALLIKEAGGLISDFEAGENFIKSGNVIAGNPKIFKALLQAIQPVINASKS